MFEVAGRVYYEAHVFGYKVSSFTSSGFLDRVGYEETKVSSSKIRFVKEKWIEIVVGIAVLMMVTKGRTQKRETIKK